MKRREFVAGGLGMLVLRCAQAEADRRSILVATLDEGRADGRGHLWNIFSTRMRELGYVEGQGYSISRHWGEGEPARLDALAAEIVARRPSVIATAGTPSALSMKAATATIPIVFAAVAAPVRSGLVRRLARPEANLTGITNIGADLVGKWLELLREVAPGLRALAFMTDPDNPAAMVLFGEIRDMARRRGIAVQLLDGSSAEDVTRSFRILEHEKVDGFMTSAAGTLIAHRQQIVDGVARLRLPALYGSKSFPEVGGLMSYAADAAQQWKRFAELVHGILRGAKPSDIPVEQPTSFELVINMRSARVLGLTIPQSMLLRADQVSG